MFKWLQKKYEIDKELLQQVISQNKKLQEKVDHLQSQVDQLQVEVKQKDRTLSELQKELLKDHSLSDEQLAVVDLLENTNDNYFITGKAGTGKSTVLKFFVEHTSKKVVTLAPTGVAANIVHGRTIHSFFSLGPFFQDVTNHAIVNNGINADQKLIDELDTIIIDEASMLRADVMDMIDHKLRIAKKSHAPYGGIQIVLFGDLFQLAPVIKGEEGVLISKKYGTPYFFGAPSAAHFTVCGLKKKVYRQSDPYFLSILNKIRVGTATQNDLDNLYNRCKNNCSDNGTEMFIVPTNKQVNAINNEKMGLLDSKEYSYTAKCEGDASEEDSPASSIITLKVGASVMMLCNDPNKSFVNGTLAKVVELSHSMIKVSIKDVGIISVDKYTWPKYKYVYNEDEDKIETVQTGSFTQYPIKPAYAITIHKSQGQTYDQAVIDYSENGAFAPGQTYVALSRCRSLAGVRLLAPLKIQDIKVSQEVISFMSERFVPVLDYIKRRLS